MNYDRSIPKKHCINKSVLKTTPLSNILELLTIKCFNTDSENILIDIHVYP